MKGKETLMHEKNIDLLPLTWPPIEDLAHNPGMRPDPESNQQPSGLQAGAQSTELHRPGLKPFFIIKRLDIIYLMQVEFHLIPL